MSLNIHRELRTLITRRDNRFCADCTVALTAPKTIFVSMRFSAFVCLECAGVHRSFGTHITRVRSVVLDKWTDEDIEAVKGGNQMCNNVYEHYVPRTWIDLKPQPGADRDHRRQWIENKYVARLFILPNLVEADERSGGRHARGGDSLKLPIRLVDCFVVVAPGDLKLDPRQASLVDAPPESIRFQPRIADCYPSMQDEPGRAPPEHLAQFVTPGPCTLLRREKPPTAFSFVLTAVTSVKQHGVALVIWEEKEVQDLAPWFEKVPPEERPRWLTSAASQDYVNIVFVPKTLVLLSHYPFYGVFQQFLTELYRVSLSTSPLPIERYIASFVSETPLPPQGQVTVQYPLPDRTLLIARPPKNRLPMANFSYRALFACLSLENALAVFGSLLLENRVAVFSRYVSILTPVTEALLSLLFPFDWQGAFIPVIPQAMVDMLEAPVPFLLGCHRKFLDETPQRRWPEGVVMVDLDRDEVHLGLDEESRTPRSSPALPTKEARKLKEALREHASPAYGLIERRRRQHLAEAASRRTSQQGPRRASIVGGAVDEVENDDDDYLGPDAAFPDHGIMPIINWSHDQGMSSSNTYQSNAQGQQKTGLLEGPGWSGAHILDADGNEDPSKTGGDGFSAEGIRAAFLRFFVSTFREYSRFVRPAEQTKISKSYEVPRLFDEAGFLQASHHLSHDSHGFLTTLLQSQMFERFLEERSFQPDRPEIRFFDESILQKRNRSVQTRTKHATPFLDDTENDFREIFMCQPPSPYGLSANSEYVYLHGFPTMEAANFGVIRPPRRLFKIPEQLRRKRINARQGGKNGLSFEQIVEKSYKNASKRGRARSGRSAAERATSADSRPEVDEDEKSNLAPGINVDALLASVVALQSLMRMQVAKKRIERMHAAARTVQAHFRAWKAGERARVNWAQLQEVVLLIQRSIRGRLARDAARRRREAARTVQSFMRMHCRRKQFWRLRDAATLVQAVERMRRSVRAYRTIRTLVVRMQAAFRGFVQRKESLKERKFLLTTMRSLLYRLWNLAHTPLRDRSKFWLLFQGHSMLCLALHHQELERVARLLGILDPSHLRSPHFSYRRQFDEVERWLQNPAPGATHRTRPHGGDGSDKQSSVVVGENVKDESATSARDEKEEGREQPGAADTAAGDAARLRLLEVARTNELQERRDLYLRLKKSSTDEIKSSFFKMFKLESEKKRKRTLAQIVWSDDDRAGLARADASAEVVVATFDADMRTRDWVEELRAQRIRYDVLTTVQACLLTIQEHRQVTRTLVSLGRDARSSAKYPLKPLEGCHKEALSALGF
mmetsp:Transcript_2113/g.9260  ORF Transcript_2113/g.9260 Transcript_2113/m.9260 type:complete len:1300 (-) Transcript_2113:257-4156(-)